MSLTTTILLIYAACLVGAIASPPSHGLRERSDRSPPSRRLLGGMLVPGLALLAAAALPLPARAEGAAAKPVTGPATVIDGATLEVAGLRLRLDGIDAPDLDQTCFDGRERGYACGRAAADTLAERIGGAPVACVPRRIVEGQATALCRLGADDLAAWMVETGRAIADRTVADGYAALEERAWGRRLGLWSGVFQLPADWRQARRVAANVPRKAASLQVASVPAR